MNSTLKSLVFWIVLVVIGLMVWNISNTFKKPATPVQFSEFMTQVEASVAGPTPLRRSAISGAV